MFKRLAARREAWRAESSRRNKERIARDKLKAEETFKLASIHGKRHLARVSEWVYKVLDERSK